MGLFGPQNQFIVHSISILPNSQLKLGEIIGNRRNLPLRTVLTGCNNHRKLHKPALLHLQSYQTQPRLRSNKLGGLTIVHSKYSPRNTRKDTPPNYCEDSSRWWVQKVHSNSSIRQLTTGLRGPLQIVQLDVTVSQLRTYVLTPTSPLCSSLRTLPKHE